jgi:hypothetical protein
MPETDAPLLTTINDAVNENDNSPMYAVFGAHPSSLPALSEELTPPIQYRLQSNDSECRSISKTNAAAAVERACVATGPFPTENRNVTGDKA